MAAALAQDAELLGFGANIMGFFVGWHYAKQGYGMAIVDSVLKKRYFTDQDKKLLLLNAYACWILSWLGMNWLYSSSARNFQGFSYATLDIPVWMPAAASVAAAVTTSLVIYMLIRRRTAGQKLPVNGLIAYGASLYVWLFPIFDPLFALVIPVMHSLQYLVVVWRYQLNLDADHRADAAGRVKPKMLGGSVQPTTAMRFARFLVIGVALGYLGFWGLPKLLEAAMPYDRDVFKGALYLFTFWIFINVHHYFLDNVMWRKENPDVRKHLFSRP